MKRAESDQTKSHGRREEDEKFLRWKPRKGIVYEKGELSKERWRAVRGMYFCSCSCKLCLSEAQYWEEQTTCSRGEEVAVLLREEVCQGSRSEMEEKHQSLKYALAVKSGSKVC